MTAVDLHGPIERILDRANKQFDKAILHHEGHAVRLARVADALSLIALAFPQIGANAIAVHEAFWSIHRRTRENDKSSESETP